MNNIDLKKELESLEKEEEILLTKHKDKHFSNILEGEKYIKENQVELQRLNIIQKRVREIRIQLMTPQEKQEYLEYQNKIKENYIYIVEKLSDVNLSELERTNFINENKQKINELNKLSKEIADLRWQLMTPQEQKDYLDKYSDD
ncbi:hypothetical protein ACM39_10575 [Chryseobacterium sp. FH2]|uniref:hypothetical protein n=1 Tax=Chryseobacterium sp. FH2 TaxID=1674291 RepID=UPI00065AF67A|nr:hypothetical protein [Chryseobacterium sp. FH2]KMQ67790.1 hypothetical protein ACM39_10575 [Chryseobacterium sp. FH2]